MLIGADLALNHGSLVTIDGHILAEYVDGKGMMSGADDLFTLACMLSRATPYKSTVIVEWDRDMGHWRSPTVGVLMTMLAAYYAALAQSARHCEVHFVTPALVRGCLDEEPTIGKKQLHAIARMAYLVPDGLDDKEGDRLDAWLLAKTWDCSSKEYQI